MRPLTFAVEEFYHIYNRGTDKRKIFLNNKDKERFLKLLYLCNSTKAIVWSDIIRGQEFSFDHGESLVDIGAYCLMSNHFHMLLHEKKEGGISTFMHKLCTAFSMYFNKKYDRTGTLFEGKFKAKHADSDEYLRYLFAYIHLNPIQHIEPEWKENGIADIAVAKNYLHNYQYSSFPDFLDNDRIENKVLNLEVFPEYFESKKEFQDYHSDWLSFNDSYIKETLGQVT